jgi:nitric oxide synthase oxygenase domain/subunit
MNSRANLNSHKKRIEEITDSIHSTNTYELMEAELSFGARTAWRNASRYFLVLNVLILN